ncbi:BMC domain-containing protein [Neobacillus sp. Marseille-QA0830]
MKALGFIETVGLAAAVEAADTAVKSANVTLLGYELTKGGGMVLIKFEGDVGAVKAALEAGSMQARRVSKVASSHMIARPHDELEGMIYSKSTVGPAHKDEKELPQAPAASASRPEQPEVQVEGRTEKADEELHVDSASIPDDENIGDEALLADNQPEEVDSALEAPPILEEPADGQEPREEETKIFSEQIVKKATCNQCHDPKCPRQKGDLRSTCIHYKEIGGTENE